MELEKDVAFVVTTLDRICVFSWFSQWKKKIGHLSGSSTKRKVPMRDIASSFSFLFCKEKTYLRHNCI